MPDDFFRYGLFVIGCLLAGFTLSVMIERRATKRRLLSRIEGAADIYSVRSTEIPVKHLFSLHALSLFFDRVLVDFKRLREIDGSVLRLVLAAGAGGIVLGCVVLMLARSTVLSVPCALFGGYASAQFYKQIRFQTYAEAVLKSFPNAVDGLIRCLKAGFDLSRSLTIISDELPPELQYEFKMMIRNRNLGQSLGDAMHYLASRLLSREALFLATLIAVQERTGGPLITALESLSQILKDRERLRQKRLIASAEARMSAFILGGLPLAVAILLFSTNSSYRDILIGTQAGRIALMFGFGLLLIGSVVMHRMIRMPQS